jgi:hypothetical protein
MRDISRPGCWFIRKIIMPLIIPYRLLLAGIRALEWFSSPTQVLSLFLEGPPPKSLVIDFSDSLVLACSIGFLENSFVYGAVTNYQHSELHVNSVYSVAKSLVQSNSFQPRAMNFSLRSLFSLAEQKHELVHPGSRSHTLAMTSYPG